MKDWNPYCHNEVRNPCTKDCSGRKPGCGITCEAWKEYAERRQELYDRRRKNAEVNHG